MASVEELCDNITLINKSHNILTGNVAELRERFSGNRYELIYTATEQPLAPALGDLVSDLAIEAPSRQGTVRATFALREPDALKSVIAAANNTVTIRGFNRLLPSMNDIFISTVKASDSLTTSTTEL